MAAGYLPAPGTQYGPCLDGCSHRDCAATVRTAASPCVTCLLPIGYETGFFRNHENHRVTPGDEPEYEHAMCSYERHGV